MGQLIMMSYESSENRALLNQLFSIGTACSKHGTQNVNL